MHKKVCLLNPLLCSRISSLVVIVVSCFFTTYFLTDCLCSFAAQWEVINAKKKKKEQEAATPSAAFEAAFNTFIAAYNKVPCEDKSERIRRVMRNTGMRDTEVVCEMLDLFAAEGLQRTAVGGLASSGAPVNCNNNHSLNGETCGCAECPFKKELERIDDFYNDFLSNPSAL